WQKLEISSENIDQHFPNDYDGNIGIRNGDSSNYLIDIDVDDPQVLAIIYAFLPHTQTFGRTSKPASHWLYKVPSKSLEKTIQFKGVDGEMLVEMRSTGSQTIFPPSIHVSGEIITFDTPPALHFFDSVTKIDGIKLNQLVSHLAATALLIKHWTVLGSRQDAVLALSGFLLVGGLELDLVKKIVEAVANATNDDEVAKRIAAVDTTAATIKQGKPVTGYAKLVELLNEKVVKQLQKWLNIKHSKTTISIDTDDQNILWPEFADSVPDGYIIYDDGVYQTQGNSKKKLCNPITIIAETISQNNDNAGLVTRYRNRDGIEVETALRSVDICTGNPFDRLIDSGFVIIPSKYAAVKDYFMQFQKLAKRYNSKTIGWVQFNGESVFVLPNQILSRNNIDIDYLPENIGLSDKKIRFSGTLEDWQSSVAQLGHGNPFMVFSICASLTGVLLNWANTESIGVHFFGRSSHGKTTILQAAGSVWGDASDKSTSAGIGTVLRWNATANAMEAMAASFNHLVLILDELGTNNANDFGKVIYNLQGGQGKQALTSNRDLRTARSWTEIFISTGEEAVRTKIEEFGKKPKAGQLLRFLDINIEEDAVFTNYHNNEPHIFVDNLKEACGNFYGTAGPTFIASLLQNTSDDASLSELISKQFRTAKEVLRSDIKTTLIPEQGRVVDRLALFLTAGYLASEFNILPYTKDEIIDAVRVVRDNWFAGNTDLADKDRGIKAVIAFLQQNIARFVAIDKDGNKPIDVSEPYKLAGYRQKRSMGNCFLIIPSVFETEICIGFGYKSICRELKERKLLETENGKLKKRVKTPLEARTPMYIISSAILNSTDDSGEDIFIRLLEESVNSEPTLQQILDNPFAD
ncbi:DUF927 domain-containing protein, partial [Chromatium okenii]|uniref:DUF927 domain-containing protein n=1 Tax=Chromatium okenii TaxID=61644 RepID=UPI0026EB8AA1